MPLHPQEVDLVNLAQYATYETRARSQEGSIDQLGNETKGQDHVEALMAQRRRQLKELNNAK